MSHPGLKISVNVSLDDILCIAEPFVTKRSMVRHHYKPERHMRKMGFYLQGQGHSNWISVHSIKYDYFYYMFWTADFWGRPSKFDSAYGVSCEKVALLYSRSRSLWRFWTSVNVCPDNISDRSNLVWWCIIISQIIIQKYHFAMFKVKATIVSTRSSEILKLLQSKLVWWYIITRQGKTPWILFLTFTQGVRLWLGWLWTRLLPLLAIQISKAGDSIGSSQENVERTLLL